LQQFWLETRRLLFFLPKIHLCEGRVGLQSTAHLCHTLGTDTVILKIQLREGRDIGAEGATKVARALEANTTLTQLNLETNGIGAEEKRPHGATHKIRKARALPRHRNIQKLMCLDHTAFLASYIVRISLPR